MGFLAVRARIFVAADMRVMAKLVIWFCLPALLLRRLAQQPLGEIVDSTYLARMRVVRAWHPARLRSFPPLPAGLRTCAILFAAMPMLSVYPVLA